MTRARILVIAGVAMLLAASVAARPADAVPHPAPRVAAPEQRLVMFTDSVGLGAEYALPRAFPDDWDVRVVGRPAEMVHEMERNYVRPYLSSYPSWFGDHVVLAIAYNAPYWDWPRLDREIDSIINVLTAAGVKHVYWVTLREIKPQYISAGAWRQIQPYYWYFPTVNEHLEAALARHPNLTLVDFAAHADRSGITYDAIHLNNTGAALYSELVRATVEGASTRVADGSTTRVNVADSDGAAAAAVNITTTRPRTAGHLTLHRCDEDAPVVSMHNYGRDQVAAHSGVVPLDANGDFCVTAKSATNLIVDVTGTFPDGPGFDAVTPTRWFDSRTEPTGEPLAAFSTVTLDLADVATESGLTNDADDVEAVAVVATATGATEPGWLRVTTCGADSTTSNVNYFDGAPSPNLVVVEPDADGRICVTTRAQTHVVVDLFGAFTSDVDAATAERAFDSRLPEHGAENVAAGSVTSIDVTEFVGAGDAANGVVVNLTAVGSVAPGYLTVYPCADERPEASNLNVTPGPPVANAAIVAPDADGLICVFALTETHLIVDLLGSIGTPFAGRTPVRALDTRG